MTREGIPIALQVSSGNRADITIFARVISDLRQRFAVGRVVVVADRWVVSESSLVAHDRVGVGYILAISLRK
ncbi:MAG: transposase [Dehalococcoidia bacterium]|nr:transposase [Dehalococcoidia bacterium]